MVYKFRITVPSSKRFFRECEIKGESSLYKVMEFIQGQMGFVPDMMVLFQGVDENGKVAREYGLFDMGDGSIDNVTLDDSMKKGDVALRFVFNLSMGLYMDLTFLGEVPCDIREKYPRMTAEKGHAPQQFSAVYVEDDFEDRPHGIPHPVESDVADDDDDEDDDEKDDDEMFDAEELPEGTE